ncbi:MAG: NAD-dependent epimerase/dehydratase family protein [Rickettsiales bacterium]
MAFFLVTGGSGFIGSHLTDELLDAGHRVRILDDLSTGKCANVRDAAEIVVGDVSRPDVVSHAMAGVDGCFHLAAIASVQRSNEE